MDNLKIIGKNEILEVTKISNLEILNKLLKLIEETASNGKTHLWVEYEVPSAVLRWLRQNGLKVDYSEDDRIKGDGSIIKGPNFYANWK